MEKKKKKHKWEEGEVVWEHLNTKEAGGESDEESEVASIVIFESSI